MNETQKKALCDLCRQYGEMADRMVNGPSGADQADSEAYYCQRRVYAAVIQGVDVETAIETEDKRWRAYAAEQVKKVDAAPKIKRGPSRGHSAISHRWVSADKFDGMKAHIRFMVRKCLGESNA